MKRLVPELAWAKSVRRMIDVQPMALKYPLSTIEAQATSLRRLHASFFIGLSEHPSSPMSYVTGKADPLNLGANRMLKCRFISPLR